MMEEFDAGERKALLKNALIRIKELRTRLDTLERAGHEPIAIIGIGCRFPGGANDLAAYWNLLHNGVDAVRPVPPDRWDVKIFDHLELENPIAWQGGFLEGIEDFDPQFFNISPREANNLDPQQRWILEASWEALEHAGVTADQLSGSQTGVFVGVSGSDFAHLVRVQDPRDQDIYAATGSALNAIPGRVAFIMGLHGPTVAVDTACSSSLVAIHLACQSLRGGESDVALAGGVNSVLNPDIYVSFSRWGMMSPDGRCKTFDASANGFVRGEGIGVLVLKRLSDAQAHGDRILAVIRGSAVNNDGRSSGLTVPNGRAQQAVVRAALKDAGVAPGQVSYVEAHGTGTALGDPIEVEALGAVLGEGRPEGFPLILSSVKTNLGHLESASGVAGLIKVVLSMQHDEIPPHLHLKERSPRIPWPNFPVEIPTEPRPWPAGDQPRIAGVSSFGFSGTNAHVVLEEAPRRAGQGLPAKQAEIDGPANLLVLSAKTPQALKDLAGRYSRHLNTTSQVPLSCICRTAALGRTPMLYRLAVTGAGREEIRDALDAFSAGENPSAVSSGQAGRGGPAKVAFLFTGQGSQWAGMGKQLYDSQPLFRHTLDRCAELLKPYLAQPLLSVVFPEGEAEPFLDHTTYTQPALFALEYSLAVLWQSWGIKPYAVLGHSVGEYAAACAAGVFSLEDGLKLIASRARLMGSLPEGGQMVAVMASEAAVSQALARSDAQITLAAINGPESAVISGAASQVEAVVELLHQEGINTRPLKVSHAFHSPLMDPILDRFEQTAGEIQYQHPTVPVISNVTGKAETELLTSPAYWRRHVRMPVRFYEGIQALYDQGCRLFIEIGPHPVLLGMGQHCLPETAEPVFWLPSLRRSRADLQQMLESLGSLWARGTAVDWDSVYQDVPSRLVDLPTYPFQRQRYWLESPVEKRAARQPAPADQVHPLLGTRIASPLIKDTVYETRLWVDQPAFLNDHRLYGTAIFPGTGYLEIGQAAARLLLPGQRAVLEDVSILDLLYLQEEGERVIQVVLQAAQAGIPPRFQVYSLNTDQPDAWTLNAEGKILPQGSLLPAGDSPIAEARARCQTEMSGADYYQLLSPVWFAYGPSFKCLKRVWRTDYESVGEIALPAELAAEAEKYVLHPGLLDACIQLMGAAIPNMEELIGRGIFYAPVNIKRYQIRASGISHLVARTHLEPIGSEDSTMVGSIWLYDQSGALLGSVEEIFMRKVTREMIAAAAYRPDDGSLYHLAWEDQPLPEKAASGSEPAGRWLVVDSSGGTGSSGSGKALVEAANDGGAYRVVTTAAASQAIRDAWGKNGAGEPVSGVIYYAAGGTGSSDGSAETFTTAMLREAQEASLGGLVETVQALIDSQAGAAGQPALVILTRGAQAILPGDPVPSLSQAGVWGMGRSIAAEHPELGCVLIDLDPQASNQEAAQHLNRSLRAIKLGEHENQVGFRSARRYTARIERLPAGSSDKQLSPGQSSPGQPGDGPLKLAITERGVLDNVELRPVSRSQPGPRQVEIEVKAAGLNFRDVLNVLGMLPGAGDDLGFECAGVVTALGEGVTRWKVGDVVMGIATGSFASYVPTHEDLVIGIPDGMSFVEAATIPLTFLTAYYGLVHLGCLKEGERVLIHSAAGGVGMSAVQLALRVGAEIYATAGNEEKRAVLRGMGVHHVMDSRTLQFADQIMDLTRGEGVDVVLNALTDDFLARSFDVLKPGGRFLEIGKRGILTHEQVAALGKNYQYFIIFLGDVCVNEPELIQNMLRALVDEFTSGGLKPLPSTVYRMEDAPQALRFMAQARHIGKIVLTLPERQPASAAPQPAEVRSDATYLITGGLGGIGLKTAQWLALKGAGSLVLVSRRPPGEEIQPQLEQIRAAGAQLTVVSADVSREEDMVRVLGEIQAGLPPLHGIFHTAGVIEDTVFSELDWPRVDRVLAPKVYGAWNLHRHTLDLPLDFFVLFSAGAGVFGSAGQANYAAANAFLDALAHYRRARGLPALSVNWGPWAEVGMAARLSEALQNRWTQQGVQLMPPDECFRELEKLLGTGFSQGIVISINWPVFLSQFVSDQKPPLLSNMVDHQPIPQKPVQEVKAPANLLEQLVSVVPAQRRALLERQVRVLISQIIGMKDSEQIQSSYSLVELGIDSLMVVELRNRINQSYQLNVPLSYLFKIPALVDLYSHLSDLVLSNGEVSTEERDSAGEREEIQL